MLAYLIGQLSNKLISDLLKYAGMILFLNLSLAEIVPLIGLIDQLKKVCNIYLSVLKTTLTRLNNIFVVFKVPELLASLWSTPKYEIWALKRQALKIS